LGVVQTSNSPTIVRARTARSILTALALTAVLILAASAKTAESRPSPGPTKAPFPPAVIGVTLVSAKDVGRIHDPMSQRAYMWDNNNPVTYSDPSGYDPYIILDHQGAFGLGHLEIAIIASGQTSGQLYSQHPNSEGSFIAKEQIDSQKKLTCEDCNRWSRREGIRFYI